jgi:hypothetical protein
VTFPPENYCFHFISKKIRDNKKLHKKPTLVSKLTNDGDNGGMPEVEKETGLQRNLAALIVVHPAIRSHL